MELIFHHIVFEVASTGSVLENINSTPYSDPTNEFPIEPWNPGGPTIPPEPWNPVSPNGPLSPKDPWNPEFPTL